MKNIKKVLPLLSVSSMLLMACSTKTVAEKEIDPVVGVIEEVVDEEIKEEVVVEDSLRPYELETKFNYTVVGADVENEYFNNSERDMSKHPEAHVVSEELRELQSKMWGGLKHQGDAIDDIINTFIDSDPSMDYSHIYGDDDLTYELDPDDYNFKAHIDTENIKNLSRLSDDPIPVLMPTTLSVERQTDRHIFVVIDKELDTEFSNFYGAPSRAEIVHNANQEYLDFVNNAETNVGRHSSVDGHMYHRYYQDLYGAYGAILHESDDYIIALYPTTDTTYNKEFFDYSDDDDVSRITENPGMLKEFIELFTENDEIQAKLQEHF